MLDDPEREGYVVGAVVKGATKAAQKLIKETTKKPKEPVKVVRKTPKKLRRAHRTKEQIQEDGEKIDYRRGLTTNFSLGAPDSDKLRKLKASQIPEGTPEFKTAFKKAWKAKEDTFLHQDKEYKVEDLIQEGTQMYKSSFNEGGKMKYAEGSMLTPPEREGYAQGSKIETPLPKLGDLTPEDRDRIKINNQKAMEKSPLYQQLKKEYEDNKNKNKEESAIEAFKRERAEDEERKSKSSDPATPPPKAPRDPDVFSKGGMMSYAEGGSMLMPPEMEAEQSMPVDTYDNIPPDEMAAAEASQLPDEEMESNYLTYVLNESLEPEDQEYLMSVLEGDERLSGIFDKVMDVAGEFSGEGKVDGPGTGVSDSIPARLSDGEFVVTEKATDEIGADNLQKMMDEAEQAYDGGYMKKAFGGLTLDPMQDEKNMYGMDQMKSTQDELRKQMLGANRMPSVVR